MPRPRGEYAKSAQVKRGILDACITAFGSSGFHGVSMAEVARRAGISYTGLLHHFPNKEALLTAVIALQDIRAEKLLADRATPDADPLPPLRALLSALASRQAGLVQMSVVLSAEASAPTHPAHEHFQRRYRAMRRFLTERFESLRSAGRLESTVDSTALAAATIALVEGLHTQWLYEPDAIDVDGAITGVLGTFIPELTMIEGPQVAPVVAR